MSLNERDTETYTVRVPAELADQIDAVWERRGYASRSEFIRGALRSAVSPSVTISEEFLEHLEVSREEREQGQSVALEDVD